MKRNDPRFEPLQAFYLASVMASGLTDEGDTQGRVECCWRREGWRHAYGLKGGEVIALECALSIGYLGTWAHERIQRAYEAEKR